MAESLHDVKADVLDGNKMVSKFEFQPSYYFYFQTNTFGKGMNIIFLQVM